MNNPQSVGEQLLQLQNIAYVKQFMQKLSVKSLFVVTLLLAVCNSLAVFLFKDVYASMLDIFAQFSTEFSSSDIESMKTLLSAGITTYAIIVLAVSLILPITLLFIIIRSSSDNPSVIPLGAVKFLYVISFIQTIFIIVTSVMSVLLQGISIFAQEDMLSAVISFISSCVFIFISCMYYVMQTKFLGAVKHSSTGYSLIYGTSNGFGVFSVVYAIFLGIFSAVCVVLYIVMYSLLSSNDFANNAEFQTFVEMGGLNLIESMKPLFIIGLVILVLTTIYHITMAMVAFAYKNVIRAAIRESFSTTKRQSVTINSAFRTYGGQSSYKNYNYNSASGASQQSYAEVHKNLTNNQNAVTPTETPEANPYNNYQGSPASPVIPEYNGSVPQNNNFAYPQQPDYNNMQNNAPVQSGGSFGFQQDPSNNPYNE